jgi:addiction module HigA family antidote
MAVSRRALERQPTPPSSYIRGEVLGANGLTQEQLADALGVSRLTVNQLVNNRRSITADMALRLEHLTGVSASQWLTLQQNYDLWLTRQRNPEEYIKIRPLSPPSEYE